jgi:5-methylthioadenosine/S-adenosylhomocysteine deaminase
MATDYMQKISMRNKIFFLILVLLVASGFLIWHFDRHQHQAFQTNSYAADILITNAEVLTLDQKSDIYNPGWVEIRDGKIIGLGSGRAPADISASKTIDATGKLVMPGLVNTHAHSAMTLLRGLDDNDAFEPWLKSTAVYEQQITPDDVYWGSLLAEDEMICSGTTAFNDMYFFPENTAEAVSQAGMRAVLRIPTTDNNGQITFDQNFISQNQNNPLITFSLAPNPFLDYTISELKQISDYALKNNYLVHIHFEEDPQNRTDSLAKYQLTPTELISEAGFLRNKLVLAHAADVNQDEINLLAQYPNVGVSFNPKSEAKLGPFLPPVVEMLNSGLNVGIGTDGAASSNSLDMFGQINFAAYGYLKCLSPDKFCQNGYTINPEKIVRMATIDGAKILGLDDKIGSLKAGKQADIIILDLQQAHLQPSYDIYSTLVYNTSGSDVVDSIINGKIVMLDRRLLTINEADVIKKVEDISNKFKK